MGTPLVGALNAQGWEKFAIFDRNRRLSQKRYKIGPWLLWIINRKSVVADRSVSVPMTLSDLEKRDVSGQNFSGGSPHLRSYDFT